MPGRYRILSLATMLAVLLAPLLVAQQEKRKPAPETMTGPKVGEKAPSFTLKDQFAKERTLDELVKHGNVALVFYRSADW